MGEEEKKSHTRLRTRESEGKVAPNTVWERGTKRFSRGEKRRQTTGFSARPMGERKKDEEKKGRPVPYPQVSQKLGREDFQ